MSFIALAEDQGQTIKVRVTFSDDAGNETTLTSVATEAVEAAPQPDSPATGVPTITRTAQVGETLTVDTSGIADTDGLVNATFSYKWLSDDADIGGATGSTYTLVDDDEGQTIKVRVIVTDDAGNETTLTSAATEAVAAAPQPDSPCHRPDNPQPSPATSSCPSWRDATRCGHYVTITDTGSTGHLHRRTVTYSYHVYRIKAIDEYETLGPGLHPGAAPAGYPVNRGGAGPLEGWR